MAATNRFHIYSLGAREEAERITRIGAGRICICVVYGVVVAPYIPGRVRRTRERLYMYICMYASHLTLVSRRRPGCGLLSGSRVSWLQHMHITRKTSLLEFRCCGPMRCDWMRCGHIYTHACVCVLCCAWCANFNLGHTHAHTHVSGV